MMRKTKIMLVCALLALCGSAWASNDPNLIAHWKFDEGSGTIAYDSAGTNNGTLVNGPIWATGRIDGALDLDGINDYTAVGHQLINEGKSFTASAWFKLSPGFNATLPHTVLWQNGILGLRAYKQGTITADCYVGGWVTLNSGVSPVADTWYFVAETYDVATGVLRVYVDGYEKNSVSCMPIERSGERILLLGVQAGIGNYMDGVIDDVRIYDRALSDEEIWQVYLGRTLVGLEIVGPNEVPDNNSTQYTAMAIYDDNSTEDVTLEANWSVNVSDIAAIDANGVLTTGQLETPESPILISAEYTEGDANAAAQKDVVIYADCTIAELINRNIAGAIEVKQRIIEDIDKALEKENRAMRLLGRFATDPSISGLNRKDFVCVRNSTASAIKKEIDNKSGIGQSVGLLQEAQRLITGAPNLP